MGAQVISNQNRNRTRRYCCSPRAMKLVGALSVAASVLADEQDSLGLLQVNKEASVVRQSDTLDCFAKKGGCGFTGVAETIPVTTTAAPRTRPTRPQVPVTTTTVAPPSVPTAPVIGEFKASIPPHPTQKQVEDDYECKGAKTKYYEALTSYWEYDSCGHFGNDYNSKMCGGIGGNKANCPEFWTPSRGQPFLKFPGAEKKYPGISAEMKCKKAKMKWFLKSDSYTIPNNVYVKGTRDLNFAGSITLPNCDPDCYYLWHAQYECVDPPMDEMVKEAKKAAKKAKKAAKKARKRAAAAAAAKKAAAAAKKAAETLPNPGKRPAGKKDATPKQFASRLSPPDDDAHNHEDGLSSCTWNSQQMMKDCTNKDFFEFQGNVSGKYVDPSYSPSVYGNDENWRTFNSQSEEEGWTGSCVAYAKTGGRTCTQWCEDVQGMTCTRGMDDAHHQTRQLSQWLTTEGYQMDSRYGGCTLLPSGHSRKSQTDNGCNQGWGTQICACN